MAGKTWGPFTGAQLTMMFISAMAVALPGTLWAVAASDVQIVDVANNHSAAVSVARRLFTTNTMLEQSVTPSAFVHTSVFGITNRSACIPLGVPPSGKAAVITDVRVDVYDDPTPGTSQAFTVYAGTTCGAIIGDVNPPTVGHYVIPFGPGLATRTGLSVRVLGGVQGEAFADGYLVPVAQVPAS